MTNHAKQFVLQLGSLISLYVSVTFLLVLLFALINLAFPDAAEGSWASEQAAQNVRLGIAALLVFFPTYLYITRLVNVGRREGGGEYLGLTKWLVYLSLLIGGVVILGDLVTIILTFLNGELTTRFLLKALSLLVIVGAAFLYYLKDAKGYWIAHERGSIIYGGVMTLVVVGALIVGLFHIESPQTVREQKLDQRQLQDLQAIQWQIRDYLVANDGQLPNNLEEAYGAFPPPAAPDSRPAYQYDVTERGFQLCATFSADSKDNDLNITARPYYPDQGMEKSYMIINEDDWRYLAGEFCFERIVN